MSKRISRRSQGQLGLYDPPKEPEVVKKPIEDIEISHGKNFRISQVYLLTLSKYNETIKTQKKKDTRHDNLLLRGMFAGIQNSLEMPPELHDGLNSLEICLMGAGVFKRKYLYDGDMHIPSRGQPPSQPKVVKRNLASHTASRIEVGGHLNTNSLYDVVLHLLTASGVGKVYRKYKQEWVEAHKAGNHTKDEIRFKRLNPYDPSTLKERMDSLQLKHPQLLQRLKKALAKPFIPERIVKMDKYGNTTDVINRGGFITPGRTYKRGVTGRSFYRLGKYASEVYDYFQRKEVAMQR